MAQDFCCLPSSLGRTFLGAFLIQFPDLIDYALTPVIRLCPALIDPLSCFPTTPELIALFEEVVLAHAFSISSVLKQCVAPFQEGTDTPLAGREKSP